MRNSGNNIYLVEYLNSTFTKDYLKLSTSAKAIIKKAIDERLTVAPLSFGKQLSHALSGYRSLRVGRYRIIYDIDEASKKVVIHSIDHRKDAYN